MADFNLDEFIQQLRSAALEPEAKARVRELMHDAFLDPEAIRATMPVCALSPWYACAAT